MREFTLLIPSDSSMDGLVEGDTIRGSGMMGVSDLRILFARPSGGGFVHEGHMLHVRGDATARYFDDHNGFDRVRYGSHLQHVAQVTQTRRLR